MSSRSRAVLCFLALAGVGLLGAETFLVAQTASRAFRAPRVGVVDFVKIFEAYDKKIDYEKRLAKTQGDLTGQVTDLENRFRTLADEIKMLEANRAGPDQLVTKKIERYTLELQVEQLREKELGNLQRTYVKYIQEIRKEIADEIEGYARAAELELILEKRVVAERSQNFPGFEWPIVHFSTPELDVSQEIVVRLNQNYRKP
jgi:Skp family chaperone for outer membrane proteins